MKAFLKTSYPIIVLLVIAALIAVFYHSCSFTKTPIDEGRDTHSEATLFDPNAEPPEIETTSTTSHSEWSTTHFSSSYTTVPTDITSLSESLTESMSQTEEIVTTTDFTGQSEQTTSATPSQITTPLSSDTTTVTTKSPATSSPTTQTTITQSTTKPATTPSTTTKATTESTTTPATTQTTSNEPNPVVYGAIEYAILGVEVYSNEKAEVDASNKANGFLMVKYKAGGTHKLRVIITGPSGTAYVYALKSNGTYDAYPLTDGNGSYSITVYRDTGGGRYVAEYRGLVIEVALNNSLAPYLRANVYAYYGVNSTLVNIAQNLVRGKSGILAKVEAIYNYVSSTISYDYSVVGKLEGGYVPNLEQLLVVKKGICLDYSALATAMLRSQGIPTRLVFGYVRKNDGTQAYHAWIDVYSSESGWINGVIYFDGVSWKLMDPTHASTSGNYKNFQPNVSRYSVQFRH